MKSHALLALTLLLASSGGCSKSSRFADIDGGPEDRDGSPGSTTGGFGGGTFGPSTGGGTTGGGTTGGGFVTTGSTSGFFPDGGAGEMFCDPTGVCCDGLGNCCLDALSLCWSNADGGSGAPPFFGGSTGGFGGTTGGFAGPSDAGVETTDAEWEPPETVEVHQPSPTSKPAWRQSTEPLCTEEQGWVTTHSVWSDERGVFVLVGNDGFYGEFFGPFPGGMLDGGADCEGCPGLTLWHNDGSGWEPYFESQQQPFFYAEHSLTGIPGGPLFAYGYGDSFEGDGCGLANIEEGSFDCQPIYEATAVSVVSEDLAYAVADGSLIRYQNGRWGPYPGVLNSAAALTTLWAGETGLFAGGRTAGQWLQLVDDQWVVLDTGTLEHFQALWGYSETDVYAGTEEGGLYHYDGTTVTEIPWDYESCSRVYPSGIRGIWGADGVTYFHTATQLAKLEDDSVEIIAEWPCEHSDEGHEPPSITAIWGNGPNELFISLKDMREPRQECGVTFVLYYDGARLHRL